MIRKIFWMLWTALMILVVVTTGGNAQTPPPGSGKIVFVSGRVGNLQVYLMNIDGSGLVQLTNSRGTNSCPAFSPDGSKIVFVSNREGNVQPYNESGFQIYMMNVDGSSVTRLTNPPADTWCATFSPDGRKIVYTAKFGGLLSPLRIYVMNSDGSHSSPLTNFPVGPFPPRFSPDGRKILFTDVGGLAIMNADGSNAVRLRVPSGVGDCAEASFSPDGHKIVASCGTIVIMDSDGTNLVRLTQGGAHPVFSPDGNKIAFWAQPDGQKGVQIFIMNVDGSSVAPLTSPSVYSFDPAFSP